MDIKLKESLIRLAMQEAEKAISSGNSPFGAVLVDGDGNVIQSAHNLTNSTNDSTAHAEIMLIRNVGKKFFTKDLSGYSIFANSESCSMCMAAMIRAGITRIYYGADMEQHTNPYIRAEEFKSKTKENLKLEGGILAEQCRIQIENARLKNQN